MVRPCERDVGNAMLPLGSSLSIPHISGVNRPPRPSVPMVLLQVRSVTVASYSDGVSEPSGDLRPSPRQVCIARCSRPRAPCSPGGGGLGANTCWRRLAVYLVCRARFAQCVPVRTFSPACRNRSWYLGRRKAVIDRSHRSELDVSWVDALPHGRLAPEMALPAGVQ